MTKIISSIVIIVLIVGGIFYFKNMKSTTLVLTVDSGIPVVKNEEQATSTPISTTTQKVPTSVAVYTLAQVSSHNTASDCWTTINGQVYNVTSWIYKHPGGSLPIVKLCGIDGSIAFNNKHGGEARPEAELLSFKIGVLK